MSSHKTLALALCLAMTGCASHSQEASKDGGLSWWPFGSDKVADKEVKAAVTENVAKADAKSESSSRWWWPFGGDDSKADAKAAVPKIDQKATQAWLDQYEPKVREAIKGSKFELERREDVLAVTIPVDGAYNPDRPNMLLPVTLGPITQVAKAIEADSKTAILILGHADNTGATAANQKLSLERAASVSAIFRLSGLQRDRLMLKGMGSLMPRAANDSAAGRALNRRVELLLTPQNTMVALLAKYQQPVPPAAPAALVATQDVKAPAAAAKPAVKPAAKPAAKKPVAKAKTPAKATAAAKKKAAPAKPAAKKAATDKKVAANSPAKTN
ncbi:OmpA family protein [Pseudomonas xanthosomatis]|uniref:OmpA family protein n=1 Tax=Pseudomonas xanthosomatis TaxID=2842356 RepID=UPI001C3E8326|nr:OmpA family protein [Pseudomonas xanthosomatis]QXH48082.1 OmpA family protein [Pseudomonas xanthosomatis]